MATDNYGRLGSVIVDLGNNFATTESEIVAMGTRLASAGKLAGLTEPEIMALAAAMSSVGIEAEAGGTAMTQTLNAIEKAVAKGGDDLAEFARIAGMSSEEFSSAWKNDAMSALTSFIGGLGKLDEQGGEHRPRTGRLGSDRHPAEQYAQSPGSCRRPDDRRGEHCKYRLAAEYRPHQRGPTSATPPRRAG